MDQNSVVEAVLAIAAESRRVAGASGSMQLIAALTNQSFLQASVDIAAALVEQSMSGSSRSGPTSTAAPLLCALDFVWRDLASTPDKRLIDPRALVAYAEFVAPDRKSRPAHPDLVSAVVSEARTLINTSRHVRIPVGRDQPGQV